MVNDAYLAQLASDVYNPGQHGEVLQVGPFLVELIHSPEYTIGVFQGSNEILDWIYNIDSIKMDHPKGGMVHEGFYRAFLHLKDELAKLAGPFIWTGHSLAGAMAILAGIEFDRVIKVVTFGCPRVGNARFNKLITFPVTQYHCGIDPVPLIPSLFWGFRHCCAPKWFNGTSWGKFGFWGWVRCVLNASIHLKLGHTAIFSHLMFNYLKNLGPNESV